MSYNTKSKSELEGLKNEVYRKIGRNIVLFQRMELMLKYIVQHSNFSGYLSEIESISEHKAQKIQKQTMGHLVKQYIVNGLSESKEKNNEPDELKEPYFSFNIRLDIDPDEVVFQKIKQNLESMVAERNELVHQLLPKFSCENNIVEKRIKMDRYLEKQHKEMQLNFDFLKSIVDIINNGRKDLKTYLESEEADELFRFDSVKDRHLVFLIKSIEAKISNSNGWTSMTTASQIIHKNNPEEITNMKDIYRHTKLDNFILATGLFDIKEEQTDKGGIRVLYRSKAESLAN